MDVLIADGKGETVAVFGKVLATYQNLANAAMATNALSGTPAPGATAEKVLQSIVAPSLSLVPAESATVGAATKKEAPIIAEDDKDRADIHSTTRRKEAAAEATALNNAKV